MIYIYSNVLKYVDFDFSNLSVITGKLGTDEYDELVVDTPTLTETLIQPQYSSIESIKEDEECGPSSFTVSKTIFLV